MLCSWGVRMSGSFFGELKRRNVVRVAIVYAIVSWVLMQVGALMFPALRLPEWTTTMLVAFLILGFPVSIVLAWAYEMTPEGIRRTKDVGPGESIAVASGQKINHLIIAALSVAVVLLLSNMWFDKDSPAIPVVSDIDKSIAVLPFLNRSADQENAAFFAAGVHDELLTLLSGLDDLRVISRTSVARLKEDLSIAEIGELLGVATILEGQIQRAGDRLRINVQLINAADQDHVWASTYDRELTASSIFDVQSEIARTIANELHVNLSAGDNALLRVAPTASTEALRLYLLGQQHLSRDTFDSLRRGQDYFVQATELDSGYAQAWTGVARASARLFATGAIALDEYRATATPAIARAIEINSQYAEAHAQLANLQWRSGQLEDAEVSFRRAVSLGPNDPETLLLYGRYLRIAGRTDDSIPVLEKALVGDPLSTTILFELGKSEMYAGRPEKNLEISSRIREIDPSSVASFTAELQAYAWLGQLDRAWALLFRAAGLDPNDPEAAAFLGWWAEMLGDEALADEYISLANAISDSSPAALSYKMQILVRRGQQAKALEIALRALDADLDERWSSNTAFLRQVRDAAITSGDYTDALGWYARRLPDLHTNAPRISIDNIQPAADLALLFRYAGYPDKADLLIEAALAWHRDNQPEGVHGFLVNIVDAHLLALQGDADGAIARIDQAVESGWRFDWPTHLSNLNLASLFDDPRFDALRSKLQTDMSRQLEALRQDPAFASPASP